MPEKTVVAVYGTLRKDGALHNDYIRKYKGTYLRTLPLEGYKLMVLNHGGGLPVATEGSETDKVVVELYRMGPIGMRAVRHLESGYREIEAELEDGTKVVMFVRDVDIARDNPLHVVDGDYIKHRATPEKPTGQEENPEEQPNSHADFVLRLSEMLEIAKNDIYDMIESKFDKIQTEMDDELE